jgi:tetratricopeptide (TPR) repeat protein
VSFLAAEINEESVRSRLRAGEKFLHHYQFKKAWDLLEPLIQHAGKFNETLAIDILNGAGRARKWYKGDQVAEDLLKQGLNRARQENYKFGEAFALNYLGSLLRDTGKPNDALKYYKEALAIWEELDESLWIGNTFGNMSNCWQILRMYDKAHENLERALDFHRQSDNKIAILRSVSNLSLLMYWKGEFTGAINYGQEAVKLATELGDELPPSNASNIEGIVLKRIGKLKEAKTFFLGRLAQLKAAKAPEEMKIPYLRAVKNNLAHTLELLGEYNNARAIYHELLEEEKEMDTPLTFSACKGLGRLALSTGKYEEACKYLEKSLAENQEFDTLQIEELVILLAAYIELRDYKSARKVLNKIQEIDIDSRYARTLVAFGEGLMAQAERNLKEARAAFKRSIGLADKIGLVEYKIRALLQVAALDLFEYRISGSRKSLEEMKLILSKVHTAAQASNMPLQALEISILKALSHSANVDYDGAIEILEDAMGDAKTLGLDRKVSEIQKLLDEVRQNRMRALKLVDPELSWNPSKVGEYLNSAQKLMRSYGEERDIS